jgi:hypothetical protein
MILFEITYNTIVIEHFCLELSLFKDPIILESSISLTLPECVYPLSFELQDVHTLW